MAKIELTKQQWAAVENRGGALLVSAAAGSGKTKVLVDRLIGYITDPIDPKNINDFLIITYTKAAAGELRGKILDKLNLHLAMDPGNKHLRRQLSLVYLANITTVHSFCATLLREYAHLLDIAPDFRVADENESMVIKDAVLDSVMESYYETLDQRPDFEYLVDTMSAGRDDRKLCEIVLNTYEKVQCHAFPKTWIQKQREANQLDGIEGLSQTVWAREIMTEAGYVLDYWEEKLNWALAKIRRFNALEKAYGRQFSEDMVHLKALKSALSQGWDAAYQTARFEFARLGSVRNFEDPWLQERIKDVRAGYKKAVSKLQGYFCGTSQELLDDMRAVSPAVLALFQLVLDFMGAYQAEKQRKKLVDFSDLEHMAIRLLIEEGERAPTELARELSDRYAEVMVDEYQDTNEVQDLIISAISKDGRNRFMVGDVKQSIYRFRLADPGIFLEKYQSYRDDSEAEGDEPRRIILSKNFRSRKQVLECVNYVFSNLMSQRLGEMNYGENEALYAGATYPDDDDAAVEFHVLDMVGLEKNEDEDSSAKSEIEARFVARRIKELIDGGYQIMDGGKSRPVCPGDIVILMRSPSLKAANYTHALERAGIQCNTEKGTGFFQTLEISTLISLLRVIDNPRQDIPLISILHSPVYDFSSDELAQIRLAEKDIDFYDALKKRAEVCDKCRDFLKDLEQFSLYAKDVGVDKLVWRLFTATDILAVFSAMDGDLGRRDNLLRFYELARDYENSGYRGLFRFISYVNNMIERGIDLPGAGGENENAVRIMSIHKSKGLEFPVVILADTAKKFNREDFQKPVLIHPELGIGARRLDLARMLEYPTIANQAVELRLTREMLSEEMRVLYVAMTRAKEKLIITCAFPNAEAEIKKLSGSMGEKDSQMLMESSSTGRWLLLTALGREESRMSLWPLCGGAEIKLYADAMPWRIRLVPAANVQSAENMEKTVEIEAASEASDAKVKEVIRNFNFSYPYEAACNIPSKLTATQQKGRLIDVEAADDGQEIPKIKKASRSVKRPKFMEKEKGLTAAEKGTALHLVMQYLDFDHCETAENIDAQVEDLCLREIITKEQGMAVDKDKIMKFFNSPTGERLKYGKNLMREFKFSVLMDAAVFYPDIRDEEILLQGVIDCCWEEDQGLIILDFKTDAIESGRERERAERYAGQMDAYTLAMEKITRKRVAGRILYFFATGTECEV